LKETVQLETDPRFTSGRWVGFFLDKRLPGKHQMELMLTFTKGTMTGVGRDKVGEFTVRGQYQTDDGKCRWHKRYLARHDVFYQGYAEEKGIWGTWELCPKEIYGLVTGGFYIWPEGMGDPTVLTLHEKADVPAEAKELVKANQARLAKS
jgi:hypothetical protein